MTDYKLVPMEPTPEMLRKAGLTRGADYYTITKVWRAMLAAAPDVQGEPVAYLRKDQLTHVKRMGPMLGEIADSPRADRVPVYVAPQPADQKPAQDVAQLVDATTKVRYIDGLGAARISPVPDEEVAKMFHENYEKLAPSFGYETREETRKDWEEVPPNNKALMIAVIKQIRSALLTPSHNVTLGVGNGQDNLFVHGDYDSIKTVQDKIFELEKIRAKLAELEMQTQNDAMRFALSEMVRWYENISLGNSPAFQYYDLAKKGTAISRPRRTRTGTEASMTLDELKQIANEAREANYDNQ